MHLSIGYQLPDEDDSTVAIVRDFRDHVGEVYFALPGAASGRSPVGADERGVTDPAAVAVLHEELGELAGLGVDLVLLLNASCYGERAVSQALADEAIAQITDLQQRYRLAAVTTTSPFLARQIKQRLPELPVRASVNMRLGTVQAMQYLAQDFDGYYLQRDYNRDFDRIRACHRWCRDNGKSLHLLANSGCLAFCSFQAFHDNLVAHEGELSRRRDNVPQRYPSPCWEFLADRRNWPCILQNTWIRPEDLHHYRPYFATAKLATRMHTAPRRVVAAYAAERYFGNLLDLTEPGYGPLMPGYILDNSRFPDDWFEQTTRCGHNCADCDYCRRTLERVLVHVSDLAAGT